MVLGLMPDEHEAALGLPFQGASGAKLKEAVNTAGLTWHTVAKANVILCHAADPGDIELAIACCRPGLEEEIKSLGVKVVMPLDQMALPIFRIEGKLGKVRGSVFEWKKLAVLPTYSPKFIQKGMWKEEPTWFNDFGKARTVSLKKWKIPKERFNLFPTVKDVKEFVAEVLEGKKLVGVDIETTGFNEYYCKILMIGLAKGPEDVLVVPFVKQGGADYWSPKDWLVVQKLLKKLLKEGRLVFQNALFDCKHLEHHGFEIGNVEEDTMLLHHAINPELPHNLGYIVSVYGFTPLSIAA
jgi:uracil-DNA glycosylase family 4